MDEYVLLFAVFFCCIPGTSMDEQYEYEYEYRPMFFTGIYVFDTGIHVRTQQQYGSVGDMF